MSDAAAVASAAQKLLETLADATTQRVLEALAEGGLGSVGSPWMTSEEAGEYLRVDKQRIYNLKSTGALTPSGANGSRPLYHRTDLDRWARQAPAEEPASAAA